MIFIRLANQSCAQQRCGQTRSYFLGTTVRNTQISRMQIPVGGVRDMSTSDINPSFLLVLSRILRVGENQKIGAGPQVGRLSNWVPSLVRSCRKACRKRYDIQKHIHAIFLLYLLAAMDLNLRNMKITSTAFSKLYCAGSHRKDLQSRWACWGELFTEMQVVFL